MSRGRKMTPSVLKRPTIFHESSRTEQTNRQKATERNGATHREIVGLSPDVVDLEVGAVAHEDHVEHREQQACSVAEQDPVNNPATIGARQRKAREEQRQPAPWKHCGRQKEEQAVAGRKKNTQTCCANLLCELVVRFFLCEQAVRTSCAKRTGPGSSRGTCRSRRRRSGKARSRSATRSPPAQSPPEPTCQVTSAHTKRPGAVC